MSGRPKKVIDPILVEKLAAVGCTLPQIALNVGCSHRTLERRYRDAIEKGRAQGNTSILKKQYEMAMAGNVTMLIWLGKQRLEQRDKRDIVETTYQETYEDYIKRINAEVDAPK